MSFKQVLDRGRAYLVPYENKSRISWLARYATVSGVSHLSRLVMSKFFNTTVKGVDVFNEARDTSQIEARGLLTYMNHISVLDEPLIWGVIPYNMYKPWHMRWTLGADNICFRNRFRSLFFSFGKVISTKRFGAGPFQGAVDASIELLSRTTSEYSVKHPVTVSERTRKSPEWVHVFPESFVHQAMEPHKHTMRYFHWGVSRLILESTRPPIILPIFIDGMQDILPEDYSKRKPVFRRYNSKISVNFSKPLDDDVIAEYRQRWVNLIKSHGAKANEDMPEILKTGDEAQELRSELAEYLRSCLESYRQSLGYSQETLPLGRAEFWRLPENEQPIKIMKNEHQRNPPILPNDNQSN